MKIGNNKNQKLKRIIYYIMVLVVILGGVSVNTITADAATTCKTVVYYPAVSNTKVNVRKKAGSKYASYGKIDKDTAVRIRGEVKKGSKTWYKVKVKVKGKLRTGYIYSGYITKNTNCKGTVKLAAGTTLNFREQPSASANVIAKLNNKKKVKVLDFTGSWYKISCKVDGKTKIGYVAASYVSVSKKSYTTQSTTPSTSTTITGYVNEKVTSALNVRSSASTTSAILMTIPTKTTVTILGTEGTWYKIKVTYNNQTVTGYVSSEFITLNPTSNQNETSKDVYGYVNSKVTSSLNVREKASTSSTIITTIKPNTEVKILATEGDWYKINVTVSGKTLTGYVAKTYITIGKKDTTPATTATTQTKTTQATTTETKTTEKPATTVDEEIAKFPASYQTSLQALHKAHPNWKFVAVNTGLDWTTALANESYVGRNTIQSNYPKGTASLAPFSYLSTQSGAYDWSTDTYVVKDGSNWYSANPNIIAYYMDPRNFLNETDIFQFESLAYDSTQKATVVQSILSNTFMKSKYSVKDSATGKTVSGYYKTAFMDAAKSSGASPYFLATRVKQEVGVNGSGSTSGTYSGYEGIYNYYNIGAFDGTNAIAQGLQWASSGTGYGKPWTNPYKSIVGGAQYISSSYITRGQDTLYLQKFNVNPKTSTQLYVHQYMTNVQAPYSEGRTARTAYKNMNILDETIIFRIPVYKNMPSSVKKPSSAGNPNPYLKSITVKNGSTKLALTPTFVTPTSSGTLSTSTYTMVVGKSVSSVNISATTISKYATVTGIGTYTLGESGTTKKITVTGVAQDGRKQNYIIRITRQ